MKWRTGGQFEIEWISRGRLPQEPPNPKYPEGIALDITKGKVPACTAKIPYPPQMKEVGLYIVKCTRCGYVAACTSAARVDDPCSIKIPCKREDVQ